MSDEFTVPLCRSHHREVHRSTDEQAWWKQAGIDALTVAHSLWRETHPLRASAAGAMENATVLLGEEAVSRTR